MSNRCFVIGPMTGPHMDTLNWLAHDVVKPLLPPDFEVETPDSALIGNIMTHVIKACDRAHLVIANTTGNNPNVLYEIAVLDAMGRACIPVKIAGGEGDPKDLMPFDRAQYRYFTIHKTPDKRAQTDQILGEAIKKALAVREAGDMYQNPLTDFFGVPLSSFSSAYALARGYYFNLLKPAVNGILNDKLKGSAFDPKRFPNKVVEVIIPGRLNQTSRASVEKLVAGGKQVSAVTVAAPGRGITLYEWIQQKEPDFRWLDIPTTMALLRETVLGRRGRDANPDPTLPDFREIELDEIEQFTRALLGFIRRDLDADDLHATVKVVRWADTALPQ
jgi:hypothetical protein